MDFIAPLRHGFSPLSTGGSSDATPTARVSGRLPNLSVVILGSAGQIEGPSDQPRLRLEGPKIDLAHLSVNEVVEQLAGLEKLPAPLFALSEATKQLSEGSAAFAQAILPSAKKTAGMDPETAANYARSFEQEAFVVERSLRDMIENSTYPNFSDFLKELVKIAQELREKATETKLAAIEANYNLMYQAADQMLIAAEKAKESRDKQIDAERNEAIGQIVSGVVSGIISGGFAIGGAAPVGASLGQASSSIIGGSFGIASAHLKSESSVLQFESDAANTAKARLEAAAKLIESQVQIADDLRDLAKGLRDMVLRLYQDLISSQNQVIQRANV